MSPFTLATFFFSFAANSRQNQFNYSSCYSWNKNISNPISLLLFLFLLMFENFKMACEKRIKAIFVEKKNKWKKSRNKQKKKKKEIQLHMVFEQAERASVSHSRNRWWSRMKRRKIDDRNPSDIYFSFIYFIHTCALATAFNLLKIYTRSFSKNVSIQRFFRLFHFRIFFVHFVNHSHLFNSKKRENKKANGSVGKKTNSER